MATKRNTIAMRKFLAKIGLIEYYSILIEAGYKDISYLDDTVTLDDLRAAGVSKIPHRKRMMKEINKRNSELEGADDDDDDDKKKDNNLCRLEVVKEIVSGNDDETESQSESESESEAAETSESLSEFDRDHLTKEGPTEVKELSKYILYIHSANSQIFVLYIIYIYILFTICKITNMCCICYMYILFRK